MNNSYLDLVSYYENCLAKHGDTHLGVDWHNQVEAQINYRVMLEVMHNHPIQNVTLLDFGCGVSHLYEAMLTYAMSDVQYYGLDISEKFLAYARNKFPNITYYCMDILNDASYLSLPKFDYIVMNGVFTEKRNLSHDKMWCYFIEMLKRIFNKTVIGMSFNIMSAYVRKQRDVLFYISFDVLSNFITQELSRNFLIRHDYGCNTYTVYVYKNPT
jgi:SAM-dependent methyltransferase